MMKSSKVNEAYAELGRIARGPIDDAAIIKIRKAILGPVSFIVAQAVEVVSENSLRELVPEMITAFARFVEDGAKVDKGCRAKTAIAKCLNQFEYIGDEVFLIGAYHIQMEPAFGPPEDTAVELRSISASAIARINHVEAHYILADLLVDQEAGVRIAAVKALAFLGTSESDVMLRLKTIVGDANDGVIGECLLGLMKMAPTRSLEFVKRYFNGHGQVAMESAAMAVAASHLPESLDVLKDLWEDQSYLGRQALILPIALIRTDASFEYLLEILKTAERQTAIETISHLRLYSGEQYEARVRDAAKKRKDARIIAKVEEEFATG